MRLGNPPEALASALFKLVRGAASLPREALQGASGYKAFFASDPSKGARELLALSEIDADRSGHIDAAELARLREMSVKRGAFGAILEALSTHPAMPKRLERLAKLQA